MNNKIIFLFVCLLPLALRAMEAPLASPARNIWTLVKTNPEIINSRMSKNSLDLSDLGLTDLDGLELVPAIHTITRLDLSKNNLRHIPRDSFRFMPQLKVLDLSINKIEKIEPTAFNNLPQLQELNLSNNQLTRISVELGHLFSLKRLDLENNLILSIQDNAFRDLTNLEVLDMAGNDLLHLPLELFTPLKNLHFLDLSGNKRFKLLPNYKNAILKKIAPNAEIDAD